MKPDFSSNQRSKPRPASNNPLTAQEQSRFNEGFALHQKGQLAQAQEIYQQVLNAQPRHFGALHLLGVISRQANNNEGAVDLIGGFKHEVQHGLTIDEIPPQVS